VTARPSADTRLLAVAILVAAFSLRTVVVGVPPVVDGLGLSRAGETALLTLPVLLFGLLAVPATWLADRAGEIRGIVLLLTVLLFAVLARSGAHWALFPATALACGALAGLNAALPRVMGRRLRAEAGWMTGGYSLLLSLGATAAAGLTVPLRGLLDGSEEAALAFWALPIAVALVLWLGVARRSPDPPGRLIQSRDGVNPWRDGFSWKVAAFLGLTSVTYYAPLSWLPAIYEEGGIGDTEAGGLLALLNVAGLVAGLIAPILVQRRGNSISGVHWTCGLTAIGVLGILLAPTTLPAVSVTLLGLGAGAGLSVALLLIVDASAGRPRLAPMSQAVAYTIAAAGPLAMGGLEALTGDWTVPLAALTAIVGVELLAGLGAARTAPVVG
jgi:CP family cyanate transporter-like MFS transporter